MTIWAFNKVDDDQARNLVYQSIKKGVSRFGWSQKDEHNLKLKDNWSDWHSKQLFLLQIKKDDWIVHINTPVWGKCIAARVTKEYDFDEGLKCPFGDDFRHCFEVDKESVIEFDRRDDNVLPSVNLRPRGRYHRVYAEQDFKLSIENLKNKTVRLSRSETRGEFHLKERTEKLMAEITESIHIMNKSKELERFLAKVFREIDGVIDVNENGFGWKTDHGADLIVTTRSSSIGNLVFENKIIIQVKSFGGDHNSLQAVAQVREGIEKYAADAGMIITTGNSTEQLENEIQKVSEEINRPIDLLAGDDVARFVIKHAPRLIFKFEGIA
ncbi:restriction endonuclease [Endozoicomonas sp. ALE010]|uniref:restriction endonuclease n=1 Tax=Endozoicomonas sp. ALE010 TaxID=3403081 RepID=UPI003BB59FB1